MVAVSGPVDSFLMRIDKMEWICGGPVTLDVLVVSHMFRTKVSDPDHATSGAHGVELDTASSARVHSKTSAVFGPQPALKLPASTGAVSV